MLQIFKTKSLKNFAYSFLPLIVLIFGVYFTSFYDYLLFHSLSEIFSIVIAIGIFMVAWNSRDFAKNKYFLFIGISYLFVAVLDTLHTFAYKGMGVFVGFGANLPTQFWIAARLMQAFSLMIAPLFLKRKFNINFVFLSFTAVTVLILFSIFDWKIFPTMYVHGVGLTQIKKVSEYFISLLFIISIFIPIKNKKLFDKSVLNALIISMVLTAISEIFFTFYTDVYGISNLIGHLTKIAAFYFFYKAIIETALKKPYNLLFLEAKQKQEELERERNKIQRYLTTANVIFVVIDRDEKVSLINKKGCEILDYKEKEIIGKNWFDNFLPKKDIKRIRSVFKRIISGRIKPYEYHENAVIDKNGKEKMIAWSNTTVRNSSGKIISVLSSGEDITERKAMEDAIKESENRFRKIFSQSPIGIEIYDKDGKLISINKASLELFGIPNLSATKGFNIYKDPNTSEEIKEKIRNGESLRYQHTIDFEKVKRFKSYKTTKSGFMYSDVSITPLRRGKSVFGYLFQVQDITKEKELEKRKDEFISIASHELRTPVTSIKAFIQILEKRISSNIDTKNKYILSSLHEQTDRLTDLINDLLDVSRIEEGKMIFNKATFDLNKLINKVVTDFQHTSDRHQIIKKGGVSSKVFGDENRINQVLSNLLSNAIKYSPNGGKVVISASDNGEKVVVSVKDSGLGIQKKDMDKIFYRFYRTVDSQKNNSSGFGLGLYISSEIIKRHGGEMWVESRKNRGSEFYFSIPKNEIN